MELKKLSERLYYYPYESETDRPALIYVKGDKFNLAVDSGNSESHVNSFYSELKRNGLDLPDFTILTHWHWDHTFAMNYVNGITIAHKKTNEYLDSVIENFKEEDFIVNLASENIYFQTEYGNKKQFEIVKSHVEFNDSLNLDLGGICVNAFNVVSPHTDDHILIHIPDERVLLLGDSIGEDSYNFGFGGFFMDGALDKTLLTSLIEKIESIDCEICISSHVDITTKDELIKEMKSQLKSL